MMNSDVIITTIICLFFVVFYILVIEIIKKKYNFSSEFLRKSVHIGIGLLASLSPFLIPSKILLAGIGVFFVLLDGIAVITNKLKGMHGHRKSYGTVFFPMTFALLVWFFWDREKMMITYGMLILTIADGLAAIIGENIKKPHHFIGFRDLKSIEGSSIVFLITLFTTIIFLFLMTKEFHLNYLGMGIIVSMLAVAAEGLSFKGTDNITLPLLTSFIFIHFVESTGTDVLQHQIFILIGAILIFSTIVYKLRWLTVDGILATIGMAIIIIIYGGWNFITPILMFFISSSLLSKYKRDNKEKAGYQLEKDSTRNSHQVLANGGFAMLMVLVYFFTQNELFIIMYTVLIAAANADTWSTEIGFFSKSDPVSIIRRHRVPRGTSGGITLRGIAGGFAGAIFIALTASYAFYHETNIFFIGIVTVGGGIGTIVDSMLGETIQAKYICNSCSQITEQAFHCGESTALLSGYRMINNEVVNFVSPIIAALCIAILTGI